MISLPIEVREQHEHDPQKDTPDQGFSEKGLEAGKNALDAEKEFRKIEGSKPRNGSEQNIEGNVLRHERILEGKGQKETLAEQQDGSDES